MSVRRWVTMFRSRRSLKSHLYVLERMSVDSISTILEAAKYIELGTQMDPTHCPLSLYLNDKIEGDHCKGTVDVTYRDVTLFCGTETTRLPTPASAAQFLVEFDVPEAIKSRERRNERKR